MFNRLRKQVDKYNQVLVEGSYRAQPMTLMRLMRGMQPDLKLPETTDAAFGTQMIESGKSLGSKFFWGSAVLLASLATLMWAAIGFAVTGTAVYALEYRHAKRAREDVLTEINFAGQRVRGRRADLCQLHRAQVRIMNISSSLEDASVTTTAEAINNLLVGVKDARSRVTVLESGRLGAGKEAYAFSEPDFHLLNTGERKEIVPAQSVAVPAQSVAVPAAAPENVPALPAPGSLRAAWAGRKLSADEVVDGILALQESLPPEIAEKLAARLQEKAAVVKAAPAAGPAAPEA